MTDTGDRLIRELFDAAVELPPTERRTFLEQHCREHPELIAVVHALLANADVAHSPIDHPVLNIQSALDSLLDDPIKVGMRLGRYTLLERLGAGGMGVVYKAQQDEPRRVVALKLLHNAVLDDIHRMRFTFEADALGRLHHPNIVPVYEASTVASKQDMFTPYFAMEFVPGARDIAAFYRGRNSTIDDVCRVFVTICEAVQYAHLHGVLHLDLKPHNILIDSEGRARIIDFGIAKSTSSGSGPPSGSHASPTGTLRYMSPEQLTDMQVDHRADVYALGIVLRELLTVVAEAKRDAAGGMHVVRPIPAELRAVIAKATSDSRDKRYQSVAELAQDLSSYRAHMPIDVFSKSAAYRANRFVRRHWAWTVAALTLIGVMSGWGVTAAVMVWRLNGAITVANEQSTNYSALANFLSNLLIKTSPYREEGRATTMQDLVESAAASIDSDLQDAPLARGRMHAVVGRVELELGHYDGARNHLDNAINIFRSMRTPPFYELYLAEITCAQMSLDQGDIDSGYSLIKEAYDGMRRVRGEENGWTLAAMNTLANYGQVQGRLGEAERILREALVLRKRVSGDADWQTLATINDLAGVIDKAGRPDEAAQMWQAAHDVAYKQYGDEHPLTMTLSFNLAAQCLERGQPEEAIVLYRRALVSAIDMFGYQHADTLKAMTHVASALAETGDLGPADDFARNAYESYRGLLGDDAAEVAWAGCIYGWILAKQGKADIAVALLQRCLETRERIDDALSTESIGIAVRLAYAHSENGETGRAIELLRGLKTQAEKRYAAASIQIESIDDQLARVLHSAGHEEEALQLAVPILERRREVLGVGNRKYESMLRLVSEIHRSLEGGNGDSSPQPVKQ